ncbi:predicted protein [Uncinocarpus reesii 1704]|uniref:Reverse transcriptase domain-containing protein n=1 Tax=Uncinocarpus reesii (strain UAMH 1704) TaxID=336963 RepID=C4JWR8_UNCRE|nr:uncharacterized protein UREG_07010 [Uncinocarpus reesii 1704]EEP82145.1 predicted protein [Uncinocarpus reesii 1704]
MCQIPHALQKQFIDIINDSVKAGTLEPSHGPHSNPYFLIEKKKKGMCCFVDAAQHCNVIVIHDVFIPLNCDEFAEEFAGMAIASLVDLFSRYDNSLLAEESRNMTAFNTPISSYQQTALVQGAMNSPAQAQCGIAAILNSGIIPS